MASSFYIYGVGEAIEDKEYGSWTIEVFPVEVLPSASGSLTEEESISASLTTSTGGSKSISLSKSSTITATWLQFGNYNRAIPPDICKGEHVLLFRYAGEDTFFWIPLFARFDLRRQETVMNFYSNKTENATEDELNTKGYYTLIDTRNKLLQLHTDNNDTEPVGWDIKLDTNEGKFTIEDTNENVIEIDGVNNTLTMTFGSDITVTTDGNISVTSSEDTSIENTNMTTNSSGTLQMTCNGLAITSGAYELLEVLEELCDILQNQQHIGNMGPTTVSPTTLTDIVTLKAKISSMKA